MNTSDKQAALGHRRKYFVQHHESGGRTAYYSYRKGRVPVIELREDDPPLDDLILAAKAIADADLGSVISDDGTTMFCVSQSLITKLRDLLT